ncbi:putative cupredoxin-like copper-binding protein [Pseudomonas graminis]|uniref:copper-resistant cuproprotein CopI n=1 Tax=Pseudomonas graminis TaxID=158627 RepID=UPI00105DD4EA|nr:cupredoxin family protein [Pseudomonas graminis]TDV43265.1 putative cupredoxin-like copper-binding protein [Pseudomonas graminis]
MSLRYVAIALLLGASLSAQGSPGEHFAFGHPADAAHATRTVEVALGDIYFEPKSLDVKKGETVRFVLVNKGRLLHEFNLGDAAMHAAHQQEMLKMMASGMLTPTEMKHDMAGMDHGMAHGGEQASEQGAGGMKHDDPNSVLVEPGKTAELTWTFTDATGLEFACNLPGHYQAGMVGKVAISQ